MLPRSCEAQGQADRRRGRLRRRSSSLLFVIVGDRAGDRQPERARRTTSPSSRTRPTATSRRRSSTRRSSRRPPRQGISKVPAPADPQYATLRDAAMSDLITRRAGSHGEAEERGIAVSDTEIDQQLKQIKQQQFGGRAGVRAVLKQSGFTPGGGARADRAELSQHADPEQVLRRSRRASPRTTIQNFYDANKAQFTQPETRDVREILNKDQAKVEQAKAQLEKDDSAANWRRSRAKYSTDKATKNNGGLRKGVAKGQSEPALDDADLLRADRPARRAVQGPGRLLPDRGRQGHPGAVHPALEGREPDQAAAGAGHAAGGRQRRSRPTSSTSGPRGRSAPTAT